MSAECHEPIITVSLGDVATPTVMIPTILYADVKRHN